MPERPPPLLTTVRVRRECANWDRGPCHWTRECVEGRALVEFDRRVAESMSNLRPCRRARVAIGGGRVARPRCRRKRLTPLLRAEFAPDS
jgi:hypothetical protein